RRPVPRRAGPGGGGARRLKRSVVIHGHFYQPPRDDPWTGTIPVEANAAPFHDWNERIERECYAPVAPSLAAMSFACGPTLLEWMERHVAGTYARVVAAARSGGAVAMPYHHLILPLAPRRDKVTEVRWGIADFKRRFGREPEGMWLPETAVDDDTLDVLAAEGIRFTILAPHQVERVPPGGLPGWYRTRGGRRIALFTYDGAMLSESKPSPAPSPGKSPRRRSGSWRPARGAARMGSSAGAPSAAVAPRRSGACISAGARRCGRRSTGSPRSCAPRSSGTDGRCRRSSSATGCGCSRRAAGSST